MKPSSIYSILILFILIISCSRKIERKYYQTGQVKEERIYDEKNDSTNYLISDYYLNGQIKSKGRVTNGIKSDLWQEWYIDGSTKWKGKYAHGVREIKMPTTKPVVILEDSVLVKGTPTNMRVYVEGIHPTDLAVACNNGTIKNADKKELFDYIVTPKKMGLIKFYFFINNTGRITQFATDSMNVSE